MTAILGTWYRVLRVVNYYPVRLRFKSTVLNWYSTPVPTISWTNGMMRLDAQAQVYNFTLSSAVAVFFTFLRRTERLASIVNLNATGTGNVQGSSKSTTPSTGPGFTGSPGGSGDGDETESDEWDWEVINDQGIKCRPGRFDILHRNANVDDLVELFAVGLPLLPGTDFSMKNHQQRSGERTGTSDPFYGTTGAALWEYDCGPLAESSGRYVLVLKNAYGVVVESRVPSDKDEQAKALVIIEMEIIVRRVPGRKVLCVLDKWTGEVHANPNLPAEATTEHVDRMKRLYQIGVTRAFLPLTH